jgi:hypothetical protein
MIDSLAGSWNGRPFTVKSPSPVKYADERLAIERLEVEASGSVLTVTGALPLTDRAGEGELAVELQGNLATLTQYLPPDTPVSGDHADRHAERHTGRSTESRRHRRERLIVSPRLEPGFERPDARQGRQR